MTALVEKRAGLERLLKEQRDVAAQTQIDISRMQSQVQSNVKVLEETNLARDRVVAAIRTLAAGTSFAKHLKKEAIQASSVQAEIDLLKIAKERSETEVSSMRAEKQERLAEIL